MSADSDSGEKSEKEKLTLFSRIERGAGLLQSLSVISIALFAFSCYLFPDLTWRIANNLNQDEAWYFVGTWDGSNYRRPRFHAAIHGGLRHDSDGLIEAGEFLLPNTDFLLESLGQDNDDGDVIVGRSDHTTQGSRIRKVLAKDQCIYVDESLRGKTVLIDGKDLPTIWIKGVAINCNLGH